MIECISQNCVELVSMIEPHTLPRDRWCCSFGNCDAWIWQANVHLKGPTMEGWTHLQLNDLRKCMETILKVRYQGGNWFKTKRESFHDKPEDAWKPIGLEVFLLLILAYKWSDEHPHVENCVWESLTQYTLLQNVGFLLSTHLLSGKCEGPLQYFLKRLSYSGCKVV